MSAIFRWPGIGPVIQGNFAIGHGVQPGLATVEVPLSAAPAVDGTLILSAPQFELRLPNCRLQRIEHTQNNTLRLSIMDRRWKWRFPTSTFRANVRLPDGNIKPGTIRTPQQIATQLLADMGEVGFSVSALPNHTRPEMALLLQNSAWQLDRLCQSVGCAVVLGLNNRVRVVRLGDGPPLPENPLRNGSQQNAVPLMPDNVRAISGPISFEAYWRSAAVREEQNGDIKPINRLSYTPRPGGAAGWTRQEPGDFYGVARPDNRELARRCIWRMYRIVGEATGAGPSVLPPAVFPVPFGLSMNQVNFFD